MTKETWKSIPGFEGLYEVSDTGNVKRIKEYRGHIGLLKPKKSTAYWYVGLSKNNVVTYHRIHVLVANAFIGKRPIKHEVNHKNFDTTDNRVGNLEYVTRKDNRHHALMAGHGNTKLNEKIIRLVRSMWPSKSTRKIGRELGIPKSNVQYITSRKGWRFI